MKDLKDLQKMFEALQRGVKKCLDPTLVCNDRTENEGKYDEMWYFARLGTICTSLIPWKTQMKQRYFKKDSSMVFFTFFKLYKWYQIAQSVTSTPPKKQMRINLKQKTIFTWINIFLCGSTFSFPKKNVF